jgi:hypothetical protein
MLAGACSHSGKDVKDARAGARAAEQARGELERAASTTATVEAIDPDHRAVILREPKGRLFAMQVSEDVPLESLHPHAAVRVAYHEKVAFARQAPHAESQGASGPTLQETTTKELPRGVEVGRRITATVQIVAVAARGTAATFRAPDGDVRTVAVDDVQNQQQVSHLHPGDLVDVTYTEQLAVQIDSAPDGSQL